MTYKDKEKYREYQKKWRERNKKYLIEYNKIHGKEISKKYYKKNKERISANKREKYNTDPNFKQGELDRNKNYHKINKEKIALRKKEYVKIPEVRKKINERQKINRRLHIGKNREREKTKHLYPLKGHQCKFCDAKAEHRHHYTNPYIFNKFWYVCKDCHWKIHKGEKNVFLERQARK